MPARDRLAFINSFKVLFNFFFFLKVNDKVEKIEKEKKEEF